MTRAELAEDRGKALAGSPGLSQRRLGGRISSARSKEAQHAWPWEKPLLFFGTRVRLQGFSPKMRALMLSTGNTAGKLLFLRQARADDIRPHAARPFPFRDSAARRSFRLFRH